MTGSNLPTTKYSGLDFDNIIKEVKNMVREHPEYQPYWDDFLESNAGMIITTLFGLITDQLATRLDMAYDEVYLPTALKKESYLKLLSLINYKMRLPVASTVEVSFRYNGTGEGKLVLSPEYVENSGNINHKAIPGINKNGDMVFFEAINPEDYKQEISIEYDPIDPNSNVINLYEGKTKIIDFKIGNESGYEFFLSDSPIISNSVKVYRVRDGQEEELIKVESFLSREAQEERFPLPWEEIVNPDNTVTIKFPPIEILPSKNRRPSIDDTIRVFYRSGGGKVNNIAINAINRTEGDWVFRNLSEGYGGLDAETVKEAAYRGPRRIRTAGKAVTDEDYDIIINDFPEIIKSKSYGSENVPLSFYDLYGRYLSPMEVISFVLFEKSGWENRATSELAISNWGSLNLENKFNGLYGFYDSVLGERVPFKSLGSLRDYNIEGNNFKNAVVLRTSDEFKMSIVYRNEDGDWTDKDGNLIDEETEDWVVNEDMLLSITSKIPNNEEFTYFKDIPNNVFLSDLSENPNIEEIINKDAFFIGEEFKDAEEPEIYNLYFYENINAYVTGLIDLRNGFNSNFYGHKFLLSLDKREDVLINLAEFVSSQNGNYSIEAVVNIINHAIRSAYNEEYPGKDGVRLGLAITGSNWTEEINFDDDEWKEDNLYWDEDWNPPGSLGEGWKDSWIGDPVLLNEITLSMTIKYNREDDDEITISVTFGGVDGVKTYGELFNEINHKLSNYEIDGELKDTGFRIEPVRSTERIACFDFKVTYDKSSPPEDWNEVLDVAGIILKEQINPGNDLVRSLNWDYQFNDDEDFFTSKVYTNVAEIVSYLNGRYLKISSPKKGKTSQLKIKKAHDESDDILLGLFGIDFLLSEYVSHGVRKATILTDPGENYDLFDIMFENGSFLFSPLDSDSLFLNYIKKKNDDFILGNYYYENYEPGHYLHKPLDTAIYNSVYKSIEIPEENRNYEVIDFSKSRIELRFKNSKIEGINSLFNRELINDSDLNLIESKPPLEEDVQYNKYKLSGCPEIFINDFDYEDLLDEEKTAVLTIYSIDKEGSVNINLDLFEYQSINAIYNYLNNTYSEFLYTYLDNDGLWIYHKDYQKGIIKVEKNKFNKHIRINSSQDFIGEDNEGYALVRGDYYLTHERRIDIGDRGIIKMNKTSNTVRIPQYQFYINYISDRRNEFITESMIEGKIRTDEDRLTRHLKTTKIAGISNTIVTPTFGTFDLVATVYCYGRVSLARTEERLINLLKNNYSVKNRDIGEDVFRPVILSEMMRVEDVRFVDITYFGRDMQNPNTDQTLRLDGRFDEILVVSDNERSDDGFLIHGINLNVIRA